MSRVARGAAAGVAAAGAWLAAEPAFRRVTGLDYGEARLLGRLVRPRGRWGAVGTALHLATGALFGATFGALGQGGVRDGVVAAQLENAVLWPTFPVVDRLHPDRRSGHWPPLPTDRRVIGHELAGHVVFGVVLGALLPRRG